jgi:hypothetical protein
MIDQIRRVQLVPRLQQAGVAARQLKGVRTFCFTSKSPDPFDLSLDGE